jgi:hypothetical protein
VCDQQSGGTVQSVQSGVHFVLEPVRLVFAERCLVLGLSLREFTDCL